MNGVYLRWPLALLGLSGIIALFFPFIGSDGVTEAWHWFGRFITPVVTFPFLISFGYITFLVTDKSLRWLNPAGYTAAVLLSAIALSGPFSFDTDDLIPVTLFAIVPAVCIMWGIFLGVDEGLGARGLVAMQSTYAVHLSFYLAQFLHEQHNIGYWLAVSALLATLAQIAVLAAQKWGVISLYTPAAITWAIILVGY
jgi:hypothetical protein